MSWEEDERLKWDEKSAYKKKRLEMNECFKVIQFEAKDYKKTFKRNLHLSSFSQGFLDATGTRVASAPEEDASI